MNNSPPEPSHADDIASLYEHLQLSAHHYVDIGARLQLRAICQRWSVLRELHGARIDQDRES